MKSVLFLGATSDIARSLQISFAKKKMGLVLLGRDLNKLKKIKADIETRYSVKCKILKWDANNHTSKQLDVSKLSLEIEGIVSVVGYLGDQKLAESNKEERHKITTANYIAPMNFIEDCVPYFKKKNKGFIIGIASVAGERGRANNNFYGSAKAGFIAYLSGLRNRLDRLGIKVITVNPGFVDTSMTSHLDLPKLLTASPNLVAYKVMKSLAQSKDILYVKWHWRWIMLIIKCLPEKIFKNLDL